MCIKEGKISEKNPARCKKGCRNEEKDCVYSLHHDHFDLDEEGMLCGAAFYVQYLLDAQEEQW